MFQNLILAVATGIVLVLLMYWGGKCKNCGSVRNWKFVESFATPERPRRRLKNYGTNCCNCGDRTVLSQTSKD